MQIHIQITVFLATTKKHTSTEIRLHNLLSSLNTIKMIKSRRVRYAGYGEHMGELRNRYILVTKLEEKRPFKRVRHSWNDNIKWIFKKCTRRVWTRFT